MFHCPFLLIQIGDLRGMGEDKPKAGEAGCPGGPDEANTSIVFQIPVPQWIEPPLP